MRYNIKGKEVLAGNCKYYLNDLAFKNFLYPGFAYGVGYLLENAVYIELRRFGFQVYVGTIRDKEVDFVAMKDDRIIYIQVAYMMETEETMEREYASLLSIASPRTLKIRPSVFSPTGTAIPCPVASTSISLYKPSLEANIIQRTTSPPICWATSITQRFPLFITVSASWI